MIGRLWTGAVSPVTWQAAGAGFLLALLLALALGPSLIALLRRLSLGQTIREEVVQHRRKAGTPRMGGLIFLLAALPAALVASPPSPYLWGFMVVTAGMAAVGLVDDYLAAVLRRSLGLRARQKLLVQTILGLLLGGLAVGPLDLGTAVWVPFTGLSLPLGPLYLPFVVLVLIGAGNAVNLTDGLDGLAGGAVCTSAAAYALVAAALGRPELVVAASALAGGVFGFLRYNLHPARVFMGDVGSLGLGGALAALAVLTRTELLLVLIGGLYVVETLSVIIQVVSFRHLGRRVFRMAPLHHHFELGGWSEARVVAAFWGFSALCGVLGLAALAARGGGLP